MIKRKFDQSRPHRAVLYLRMSSTRQNPRSPDQQEDEIRRRVRTLGRPWVLVKVYRDDGVSGRFVHKRPGYQQMMTDIKSGAVKADLILVDTTDRFGRHGDLSTIRKRLYNQYGVLVLTAESDFLDPMSSHGKAYTAIDEMRAEGENQTKAHQVFRGKRDLARRGFWTGGPRPFGFRFRSVMGERLGSEVVLGKHLEPLPEEAAVIVKAFRRALEHGEGQSKIARALNDDPEIPAHLKPFYGSTVGYWLDNHLYHGELIWAANSTGVVDDVRRVEPNEESEIVRVPEFCPAIVDKETWDSVQALRQARRERHGPGALCRQQEQGKEKKELAPLSPGLILKYPLTGLVRCGVCKAAMRPTSGGRFDRHGKRYVYYACPRGLDHQCENRRQIREEWLRQTVVDFIVGSLFPIEARSDSEDDIGQAGQQPAENVPPAPLKLTSDLVAESSWFRELKEEILIELRRHGSEIGPSSLELEDQEWASRMEGWRQSLGNPHLGATLRAEIESEYETAVARRAEIAAVLLAREAARNSVDSAVDATEIASRLNRLANCLAASNATLTNLELSLHIDRINCWPEGRVVLRTCRLGALAGAVDLLRDDFVTDDSCDTGVGDHTEDGGSRPSPAELLSQVRPRRRARLRVSGDTTAEEEDLVAMATWAADPDRFAGLDPQWFEEREFHIPEKLHWYQEHADAVLTRVSQIRSEGKRVSLNKIAQEFGVSRPTVSRALKTAQERQTAPKSDRSEETTAA